MRFTNSHNLPQPIFEALCNDDYEHIGDISVTGLIKPPLMRQLEQRHAYEIVEDATDRIWMVLGSAVHSIIERHGQQNRLVEERLTAKVYGWEVSGKPDLLDADGTLTDYKVTSVFSFLLGDKPEWEAQLNCYAWLYQQHGFDVKRLQIVAILRDWVKRRAAVEAGYPQCGILVAPTPLWHGTETTDFIERRVALHQSAEETETENIALCTPRERWEKPTTWAVKKRGNKRALPGGVCDTLGQAEKVAASKPHPCEIEKRPGECVRCVHYCNVARFCPFGKQFVAGKEDAA